MADLKQPLGGKDSGIFCKPLNEYDPELVGEIEQHAKEALAAGAIDEDVYNLMMMLLNEGKVLVNSQVGRSYYDVDNMGPAWDWSTEVVVLNLKAVERMQEGVFELGFASLVHEVGHAWSRRECDPGEFTKRYLAQNDKGEYVWHDPWGYAKQAQYLSTVKSKLRGPGGEKRNLRNLVRKWEQGLPALIDYLQRWIPNESW